MKRRPTTRRLRRDHGVILLLVMVFLLMLAIVAATVVQTAGLQLRMAGNDQFVEEAVYQVQAIATELSLSPENFLLEGGVGYSNCPVGGQGPACDRSLLTAPVSAIAPEGVKLEYRVTRQDPLLWRDFPIRESQGTASSSGRFDAAIFEIDVRINGSERRLGTAHVVQGIALRVPVLR